MSGLVVRASFAVLVALVAVLPGTAAGAARETVDYAIGAGDALYATFDFESAYAAYQKGLAADSTAAPLWWRSARCLTDRGVRAEFDGRPTRAEEAFAQAVRAGRAAARHAPDAAEAHLELAVALGKYALSQGGKEKVRISKEVRAEADRALLLNRDLDRTYHVLGRWNRAIAELSFFEKAAAKIVYGGLPPGASMNDAVTYFEKAIELAPDVANHHLELGRTYLDLKLKDKARVEFERALRCPKRSPFDTEYKNEASALLGKTH
jgi:tetratricopeptide (TPR) repeat protein